MAYEIRPNSGSMFVNDRKTKETHPDRSGKINIDGTMYWINGWIKQSENGTHWLSLAVSPMEPAGEDGQAAPVQTTMQGLGDDEIPF